MRIENEQTHYRTRFELCPYSTTRQALSPALRCIFEWILRKETRRRGALLDLLQTKQGKIDFLVNSLQFPNGYSGGINDINQVALATRALKNAGSTSPICWAIEYDEPDGIYPFRHWHTRIGLSTTSDGTCIVNAKVSYYLLPNYIGAPLRDPGANIPNFIKELISLEDYQCCVGETIAERRCIELTQHNFRQAFADNLLSEDRELPLILITSDYDGVYPISNLDQFASYFLGMANVYALNWRSPELRSQLFDLFARDTPAYRYRCSCGNIRVYLPKINLQDAADSSNHRFFTPETIKERYHNEQSFAEMLNRSFGRGYLKTDDDVLDLNDIALREGKIAVEENKKRITELKNKLAQMPPSKNTTQEPVATSGQANIEDIKRQLEDERNNSAYLYELLSVYEKGQTKLLAQIESLEYKNMELEDEARNNQSMRYHLEQARARAEENASEARSLQNELNAINSMEHVPTTLGELLELASKLWKSKITVLDEAYRSAREFKQYDLDESWRMLSSLANSLWTISFGSQGCSNLEQEYRDETGIILTLRETGLTNADSECKRLRKRVYNGEEIDITPHIKGNGSKNASKKDDKFRIHFYLDEKNQKVVIGHCGAHLKTAGTGRM